jgi:hypothetical protein
LPKQCPRRGDPAVDRDRLEALGEAQRVEPSRPGHVVRSHQHSPPQLADGHGAHRGFGGETFVVEPAIRLPRDEH